MRKMRNYFGLRLMMFVWTSEVTIGVEFQLVEENIEAVSETQIVVDSRLHCAALCAKSDSCKVFRYTGFNRTCGFPTVNEGEAPGTLMTYPSSSLTTSTYVKQCPEGWTRIRYSCYLTDDSIRISWSMARDYCVGKGGDLAVITSQLEQDSVTETFNSTIERALWLGGHYDAKMMTWSWVTGETWNFTTFDEENYNAVPTTDCYVTLRNKMTDPERKWLCVEYWRNRSTLCERIL